MTCWFSFLCGILHSLSTDRVFLLERKTSKQIPISFLLPKLDVSLMMLRNTGSSARRHALTQSEDSHGSCYVFLLGVDVPVGLSFTYVRFLQTDICTTEENVSSSMTCITSFGPRSNLINHVLSLSLLLHLEKLRSSYIIDQVKNDTITNGET